MSREEIITGLDIGSSSIRAVMGQSNPNDEKLHIIGAAEHPAEGVSKGVVTSIEEAVTSISQCLEKLERMTGIPVEKAFVGISGSHINSQDSHGVIAVAKADGEIKEEDVNRVIEAAQAVATPPNYEILHVIPRSFTVDNQRGIKDPEGMTGIRLEVETQIIQGLSSQINNLTKCVFRAGVDIKDIVLGVLAASEGCLNKQQKDIGVALVNMGSSTTSVVVFEEGDVLHTKILPIGSGHITNDIAIGLRTSIDLAERIKLEYGSALPGEINKREEINLSEFEGGERSVISKKQVAEIIEARLEEIFKMVDKELQKVARSGLLPAGVVFTGGGAKLPGLLEVAKKEFRLPSSIGALKNFVSAIDKVNDPAYTTALGLIIWGLKLEKGGGFKLALPNLGALSGATKKMKGWFKSLMP